MERLGLREAAERLKVSKDTLWRAIKKGELQAQRDHGPSGSQYWLDWSDVESWDERRRTSQEPQVSQATGNMSSKNPREPLEASQVSQGSQADAPHEMHPPQAPDSSVSQVYVTSRVFLDEPQAPQESQGTNAVPFLEVYSPIEAPAVVPVEVHLQALRLVERAQQQVDSLRHELGSTRRVLSEQAESLAEKESKARQAELLRAENENLKSLWEAEKEALRRELEENSQRLSSLEKKVPRWVRGLFGAK